MELFARGNSTNTFLPGTGNTSSGLEQRAVNEQVNLRHHLPLDMPISPRQDLTPNEIDYSMNDIVATHHATEPGLRLAAGLEQQPWSGCHINGVPPTQLPNQRRMESSPDSRSSGVPFPLESVTGSHANRTDEGYHSTSQVDLPFMSGGEYIQMQPPSSPLNQSGVPRHIPSPGRQFALSSLEFNVHGSPNNFQLISTPEHTGQERQVRCTEAGCQYTAKTMSEFKYVGILES
jgi:hypothetical protein